MANETAYNIGKKKIADGSFGAGTLKQLLLETTAAAGRNPDRTDIADVLAQAGVAELTATGYARQTLAGVSHTQDNSNDRENTDASDVSYGALGDPGGGDTVVAVIEYIDGAGDGTRYPVTYHEPIAQALNGGTFTVGISDFLRLT